MYAARLHGFLGEVPKIEPQMLGDLNAQAAVNTRLTSGRIDPLYYPKSQSATVKSGMLKSIYRMFDAAGNDYWLNWTEDVDCARSPNAGDTSFKLYFTSDSFEPRVTNLALATSVAPYPTAWYVLGVTPPTTAATVTSASGVSGTTETRAYVYTFVTAWGEESGPSPASALLTGKIDDTWTIASMQTAPPNSYTVTAASWAGGTLTLSTANTFGLRAGEYVTLSGFAPTAINGSWKVAGVVANTSIAITMADPGTITTGTGLAARNAPHNTTGMTKRVYRSITTAANADYYFIAEIPVAATSTTDTPTTVAGAALQTSTWAMPPVDLQGITRHPSGALVGFSGNIVCFSIPSAPYAWPIAYQNTLDYPVVNIGVYSNTVVAATQGTPYVLQGVDPSTIYPNQVDQLWPCLSKRSLVDFGSGVAYASPQGVVMVGGSSAQVFNTGGAQLLTADYYTAIEWAETTPSAMIAATYDNRYYARYVKDSSTGAGGILVVDLQNPTGVAHIDVDPQELWADPVTAKLYVVVTNLIQEWDADLALRMSATWQSKEYLMATPLNLGVAKIEADFAGSTAEEAAAAAAAAATQANNQTLITNNATAGSFNGATLNGESWNGSAIQSVSNPAKQITFQLYADGSLYYTATVGDSNVFRLPAGEKYSRFSVRVVTPIPVKSILFAETSIGLKAV